VLFVLTQYWPFLVGAAIVGLVLGWWFASPFASAPRRGRGEDGAA